MPVYFIRPIGQRGPVKIGCSRVPEERLGALMAWSPLPLEVAARTPGDLKVERRIHGVFAASHSHKEWFHASTGLDTMILRLAGGAALADIIDLSAPIDPFRTRCTRNYSPERRRYLSYVARVRNAFRRLRAGADPERCHEPRDVYIILSKWSGDYGRRPAIQPTDAEIRRLEEAISSPATHAVLWDELRYATAPSPDSQQGRAA